MTLLARPALLFALLLAAAPALPQPKTEVTIDLAADAATLDPQIQWDTDSTSVYSNIFDNLLTRDASGKIVGKLATGWHYSDDRTLVLDLRTDVAWQDGSRLTPEDVMFSVTRLLNPAFKSPQLSQFDQIAAAEVTGPAQVTLHVKAPYPVLLSQLAKLWIIPKAYVEKVGDQQFNQQPMGSGPYKVRAWQRGVEVTLDANPGYWGGKPPFATVHFRAVPDGTTRIADLRAGRADLVRGLSPDDAEALKPDHSVKVLWVPTERVAYLFINTQAGPTTDVRVRQAIAMAVDRDTLITALQQGFAKPVNEVLTPANFGYVADVPVWGFDPVKARTLVKAAGAEGAQISFLTSPAYDRRLNEAVQQMLADIGLKMSITMLDQPTYLRKRQGTPEDAGQLSQGRWSCACQDADGVIVPLFRSGSIWSKYSNPAFDTEVDAARSTLDEAQRMAHYRKAFEMLYRDVPAVGLFQDVAIYGARPGLRWTPTANEAMFVMDMSWAN